MPIPTSSPKQNDSMVSVDSASPMDSNKNVSIYANHGTVIQDKAQEFFLNEALGGMLGWSNLK